MKKRIAKIAFMLVMASFLLNSSAYASSIISPTQVHHTITATAGHGGAVSPSGNVLVEAGESQRFNFIPLSGYHIGAIMINGVNRGVFGSFTFIDVTGPQSVHVVFELNKPTAAVIPQGPISTPEEASAASPTPIPTATHMPTPTPVPTPSPVPTLTPVPTATPIPTATPETTPGLTQDEDYANINEIEEEQGGEASDTIFPLYGGAILITSPDSGPIDNMDGTFTLVSGGTVYTPQGAEIILPGYTIMENEIAFSFLDDLPVSTTIYIKGLSFRANNVLRIILDNGETFGYKLETEGNPFIDVYEDDWHYPYTMFSYEHGLMHGTGGMPPAFSPNVPITNGMVVTLLYNIMDTPDVDDLSQPFIDVVPNDWFYAPVKWAISQAIVFGSEGASFLPLMPVEREALAVIFNRLAEIAGFRLPPLREYGLFIDEDSINVYAKSAVNRLYTAGVVNGKDGNMFYPQGEATRAEIATIIYQLLTVAELSPVIEEYDDNGEIAFEGITSIARE